jgi:NADH:ubiquinone oxidoreductase subunit K
MLVGTLGAAEVGVGFAVVVDVTRRNARAGKAAVSPLDV